jgi:hypothetical protein
MHGQQNIKYGDNSPPHRLPCSQTCVRSGVACHAGGNLCSTPCLVEPYELVVSTSLLLTAHAFER